MKFLKCLFVLVGILSCSFAFGWQTSDPDMMALGSMFVGPTHTSKVGTFNWSDPNAWQPAQVPPDNSKVYIPVGSTVNLNANTARIKWIRVAGELKAVPTATVTLKVETLVSDENSRIHFGDTTAPITGKLSVIFIDNGVIDTTWDTRMLSRGLLTMGTVDLVGSEVTHSVLSQGGNVGATNLSLLTAPIGWKVGHRVVVPGIAQVFTNDDDVSAINGISGTSLTLSTPFSFAHPVTAARPTPVVNLDRNLSFESESSVLDRRAHVMFIHPKVLNVRYAEFRNLGRTDKAVKVTDIPVLTNLRGRYSFHIHQAGTKKSTVPPAPDLTITGCVVEDSPGWGFVNHSSRVTFDKCSSFNVRGGAFVGETGEEVGLFKNCISVRSGNGAVETSISDDRGVADWAFQGNGFWVQGGGIHIEDCISTGNKSVPYVFMGDDFVLPGQTATKFASENLEDPTWTTSPTVYIKQVPPRFKRNISFGSEDGLVVWNMGGNASPRSYVPSPGLYEDSYFEANKSGVLLGYPSWHTFNRIKAFSATWTGAGCGNTGVATGMVFNGCDFQGYLVGIVSPTSGDSQIVNCNLYAPTGIHINNSYQSMGRTLQITGNTFPTIPASVITMLNASIYRWPLGKYQDQQAKKILFSYNAATRSLYEASTGGLFGIFFQSYNTTDIPGDTITYNGQRLYLPEEGPNWSHVDSVGLPDWLRNKTTKQIWDTYKLALGGVILPADVTQPADIVGLVSNQARTVLPKMQVNKVTTKNYQETNQTTGFVLQVKDAAGVFRTSGPWNLANQSWNILFITIDGYQRGVLVYCDSAGTFTPNW